MATQLYKGEALLKAAVIDRLFAGPHVDDDAVIISEMTVANWSRRADVVLANGSLWAFEVKSELDNLGRLPGQLEAFTSHFEKVCVVCVPKFEDAVNAILPEGVGLWITYKDGTVKERKRPRFSPLAKPAAISLLKVDELRSLLCKHGVKPYALNRKALEQLAMELPVDQLSAEARTAIKRRHKKQHDAFVEQRRTQGTLASITELRRPKKIYAPELENASWTPVLTVVETSIPMNHPQLVNAPSGPVLRRLIRPTSA